MVNLLSEFIFALWIIMPAYIANMFPPLAGGKIPIDLKRNWIDGKRIFGNGKTFEGFGLAVFIGTLIGTSQAYLYSYVNNYTIEFSATRLPDMTLFIAFAIAFGAMFGDLAGSFIKRRIGMERGADAPLLDQLNFVVGALLFSYWFTQISFWMIIIIFLVTPIAHRLACMIGHWLKVKREPW